MKNIWPTPSSIRYPVSRPSIEPSDISSVTDALMRVELSKGKDIEYFESRFGRDHGLEIASVSNGSVALVLALRALNIGIGDEVIVPALSYAATASSVVSVGATPVFCDVDDTDWNISVSSIEQMLTDRTKAILVVHNYGCAADMDGLLSIANKFGLLIIEDTAEALGGSLNGQKLGTFGDISTWSFYGNKVITSGEGGAIGTKSQKLMDRIKLLRGQGMDPQQQFWFLEPGYNFRMSNINASLLNSQYSSLEFKLQERNRIFDLYEEELEGQICTKIVRPGSTRAPWLYSCTFKNGSHARDIANVLALSSIETRPIFFPLPDMPAFKEFPSGSYTSASRISQSGISLPTYIGLMRVDIQYICSIIREYLGSHAY